MGDFQENLKNSAFVQGEGTRVLYHCIPVPPEGPEIRPSANYGMDIPPDVRAELGIGQEHAPLVFASPYISKALAFGLMGSNQEKILNAIIPGTDAELVLACDRDNMLARTRDVTVYAFHDPGFVDLPNAERQCVSTAGVPFADTRIALKVANAQGLMRAGLQILSFRESFAEVHKEGQFNRRLQESGQSLFAVIGDLLRKGEIVWENDLAGINPHPGLAALMEMHSSPKTKPKAVVPGR